MNDESKLRHPGWMSRVQAVDAAGRRPAASGSLVEELRAQAFDRTPMLHVQRLDPELLGGMKIRVGDQQLDASVRTRLDNLCNQIIARSSYEIQSRRDHFRTG